MGWSLNAKSCISTPGAVRVFFTANVSEHEKVQALHFVARPWRFAQKFQARRDARVMGETAHGDALPKLGPTKVRNQRREDGFEREAMQRIFILRCGYSGDAWRGGR